MKNGFTLIELLSVILILGIIVAIITPLVSSMINVGSDKGLIESAENYVESLELSIKTINLDKDFNPTTCVVKENGDALCDGVTVEIEITKNIPTGGIIKLKNGVMESVVDLKIDGKLLSTDLDKEFVIK